MKKVIIIAIALIASLLLANTALGKYVGSSGNVVTTGLDSIDVKIVERTMDSDYLDKHTCEIIDAVSSIDETLNNLAPGNDIALSYKIINNGSVDVLLEGIQISVDNQELSNCIVLNWTITQYKDSQQGNSTSNIVKNKSLIDSSGSSDVSFAQIVLDNNNKTNDYCLLEMQISFQDNGLTSTSISNQTVFTITPLFIQY